MIQMDITQTLAAAAIMLGLGEYIKNRVTILSRYFIPTSVIGGIIFSLLTLAGHVHHQFTLEVDGTIRDYLLLAFFTTIGFSASFKQLKRSGTAVALFLLCAITLLIIQNIAGIIIAKGLGISPLIGLAAGSISLTGGHGTSAAFGPLLEQAGAIGALPAAIAAATYGLVAGCMIGGPVGSLLIYRHPTQHHVVTNGNNLTTIPNTPQKQSSDETILIATMLLVVCVGAGTLLNNELKTIDITLPAYLGPMIIAAVIRNIIDWRNWHIPEREFIVMGNVSLAFFLTLALMSMKLWELAAIAGPLTIILLLQTLIMFAFAYFVTFRVMGADYDAAVIAAGHCGFGMGATPNAMANMEAFTRIHGPSFKAFFVIPIVGSLFIDFFNAIVITSFISFLK